MLTINVASKRLSRFIFYAFHVELAVKMEGTRASRDGTILQSIVIKMLSNRVGVTVTPQLTPEFRNFIYHSNSADSDNSLEKRVIFKPSKTRFRISRSSSFRSLRIRFICSNRSLS